MVNNLTITIHEVEEVVSKEKYRLNSGIYVKDLKIKTADGTYEIALFGEAASNLEIRNEGTYKE